MEIVLCSMFGSFIGTAAALLWAFGKVQERLGTSFLQKKENKELLKQINRILERINERNGITQRRLEQWISVFQERLQKEMERTESD